MDNTTYKIVQWWAWQQEEFRQETLKGIPNCIIFNLVKAFFLLPPTAQERIKAAWQERQPE